MAFGRAAGALSGAGGLAAPGVIANTLKWSVLTNAQVGISQMQYEALVPKADRSSTGNLVAIIEGLANSLPFGLKFFGGEHQ